MVGDTLQDVVDDLVVVHHRAGEVRAVALTDFWVELTPVPTATELQTHGKLWATLSTVRARCDFSVERARLIGIHGHVGTVLPVVGRVSIGQCFVDATIAFRSPEVLLVHDVLSVLDQAVDDVCRKSNSTTTRTDVLECTDEWGAGDNPRQVKPIGDWNFKWNPPKVTRTEIDPLDVSSVAASFAVDVVGESTQPQVNRATVDWLITTKNIGRVMANDSVPCKLDDFLWTHHAGGNRANLRDDREQRVVRVDSDCKACLKLAVNDHSVVVWLDFEFV